MPRRVLPCKCRNTLRMLWQLKVCQTMRRRARAHLQPHSNRPVTHILTWVVRPMFCMMLNILTQHPSDSCQPHSNRQRSCRRQPAPRVHQTPNHHIAPTFHNDANKSGFKMWLAIGSQHLNSRCWGSQPKHVLNPALNKLCTLI